jgi:hypothetical protein
LPTKDQIETILFRVVSPKDLILDLIYGKYLILLSIVCNFLH